MGRRWIVFLTALGVAAALAAVLLPFAWRVQSHLAHKKAAAEVGMQMDAMDDGEVAKHWDLARWYNRNLTLENPEPGFWAAYDAILDLGQGRMGLLEVPEWDLALPITHGINGEAGHDPDTPLPIGGRGSQTVIWLDAEHPWAEDMEVYLELPGQRRCYRVVSVQMMPIGWSTEVPAGQEMLILARDSGNRRTIVRCVPWEGEIPEPQPSDETHHRELFWVAMLFFAAFLLPAGHFWQKNKQCRDLYHPYLGR